MLMHTHHSEPLVHNACSVSLPSIGKLEKSSWEVEASGRQCAQAQLLGFSVQLLEKGRELLMEAAKAIQHQRHEARVERVSVAVVLVVLVPSPGGQRAAGHLAALEMAGRKGADARGVHQDRSCGEEELAIGHQGAKVFFFL